MREPEYGSPLKKREDEDVHGGHMLWSEMVNGSLRTPKRRVIPSGTAYNTNKESSVILFANRVNHGDVR